MRIIGEKRTEPKREISTPIAPHRNLVLPVERPAEKRAYEATNRKRTVARAEMWERELKNMAGMSLATAREYVGKLPSRLAELALLAEEYGQNRQDLLRYFPKVSASTRDIYTPTRTKKRAPRAPQPVASEAQPEE